jgi:hypothetical protein
VSELKASLPSNPELHHVLIEDVPLQSVAQPGRIPVPTSTDSAGAGCPFSSRLRSVDGQTPIFQALTHFNPKIGELLIQRGADLTIRAGVPVHYERPGEILDVSATE